MAMMSWERLEKIIEWAGMSTHAFAMKIGMKRSENLYRIMRNKENVSIKLAMLILETYPQINRNWLIYGEGDMIVELEEVCEIGEKIPFFARTIDGSIGNIAEEKPAFYMHLPMFKDADLAINIADKAMEPNIPMGSTMILKKQTSDIIVYGQTYYIETQDMSMVRILRKSELSKDEIILEVANVKRYDDITIKKDRITNLYLVCGIVTRFF